MERKWKRNTIYIGARRKSKKTMDVVGQGLFSTAESLERLVDVLASKRSAEPVANDSAQRDFVTELRQNFNELSALISDLKKMMAALLEKQ